MQYSLLLKVENVSKVFSLHKHNNLKSMLTDKRYKLKSENNSFKVLNDINFEMKEGESLGLIGNNGSGKSTLLKIISGILPPSEGFVQVTEDLVAMLEIGSGFSPELTGRENISLNYALIGNKTKMKIDKLNSIIEFAEVEKYIDVPLKYYSSGMHARLAFAVAISNRPKLLIIDEVLSVGDYAFQLKCLREVKSLIKNGTSIVLVSHSSSTIKDFCTKAIYLKNGRIVSSGPVSNVMQTYENENKIIS